MFDEDFVTGADLVQPLSDSKEQHGDFIDPFA